ncbi:reverse transcriptase domain-containing protein [Tanacetum coccineum]
MSHAGDTTTTWGYGYLSYPRQYALFHYRRRSKRLPCVTYTTSFHSSHYHTFAEETPLASFRVAPWVDLRSLSTIHSTSTNFHHHHYHLYHHLCLPPPVPISLPLPSPPPPLPPLPASLFIPPPVDHKEDITRSITPLDREQDYGLYRHLDTETRCQRAEEVGYGIRDVWVDPTEAIEEIAPTTLKGFNAREIVLLMEQKALVSRESWTQSVGLSSAVNQDGQLSVVWTDSRPSRARDLTHGLLARLQGAVVAAAALMTAADVEKLIEARVSEALANQETLQNNINGHGDGSHNSKLEIEGLYALRVSTVTQDVAYAMDWETLKKMITVKYCPRDEIKKKFPAVSVSFENMSVDSVIDSRKCNAYQAKMMEKAIEFANDQMDQKGHQQQNKRQNTRKAYTAGPGEKMEYTGSFPLSSCPNDNNNNCWNSRTTQNAGTCYECGVLGHFKRDCPKLKNKNHGNQGGNGNAPVKVYVVGNAGINPDSNVITVMLLLNNRYASILFVGIKRHLSVVEVIATSYEFTAAGYSFFC